MSVNTAKTKKIKFAIYRFDPEVDKKPYMKDYVLEIPDDSDMMLLNALKLLKEEDPSLSFRHSCGEGVCGCDGMNVNGKNRLCCITHLSDLGNKITLRPLPGLPVIRDLVVDMTQFYQQYEKAKPYLMTKTPAPVTERLQSVADSEALNGLYECILCACCSTSCPSFWWRPEEFLGPAALLHAYRFLIDSRDEFKKERLEALNDAFSVMRCHGIMNCVDVCPKNLNPTKAISHIKTMLVDQET